jgi:hypothetical protein
MIGRDADKGQAQDGDLMPVENRPKGRFLFVDTLAIAFLNGKSAP